MVALAVPASAATFTVNTTNDGSGVCTTDPATNGVCTLRAAIQAAVTLGVSNTIVVPAGTYILSQAGACPFLGRLTTTLCPTGDMTIIGAGAEQTVIDGNGQGQVFVVTGAGTSVALNGITIRNGHSSVLAFGGGIYNSAVLSLTDAVILGNAANTGGGIYNDQGTLTLINCTVLGNSSIDEGAGMVNDRGTVLFTNGTMSRGNGGQLGCTITSASGFSA